MSLPTTFPQPATNADTRLHGHWLMLARVGTIGLALASLTLFFVLLPSTITFLETACSCPLTPEQVHSLGAVGLTSGEYAAYNVVIVLITTVPALVVAALLFWRRSDDWMALLVALQLMPSVILTGSWQTLGYLLHAITLTDFYLVFLMFPSGRFVPRWTRWVLLAWATFQLAPLVIAVDSMPNWIVGPLYFFFYSTLLVSQIYRYWRVSGLVERQQTKWIVFGLIVALLANIAFWQPYSFIPGVNKPDSLYTPLLYPLYQLFMAAIPLSIGIAILRYRLWDIDTIINKALVYVLLTGTLVALYTCLILGLESLAGAIGGASTQQPVVLVISTLAIAALFQPLRKRLQALIDRRFYRKKYDAAKTLATFSATLRQEVDLNDLRQHLLAVVQETMQPAHVSLWLRQPEQPAAGQTSVKAINES